MTSQQDSDLAAEAEGAAARQLPVQQALLDGGAAQGKEQRQRGGRRWWRLGGAVLLLLLLLAGVSVGLSCTTGTPGTPPMLLWRGSSHRAVAALAGQVGQKLEQFVEWVNEHRLAGSVVFVVTYCAATVLCLPATVLSLAAGAIFGVWRGILLIWIGASLGMTAAFFVGRQLLRDWILSWVGDVRIWKVVDLALKEEGWKLVLLLRLAPEVPFSILNYLLSVTSVSPLAYVVASCMGIVPGVALYAYLGSLATDLVHLGSGESRLSRAGSLIGLAVSGIALVLTVVLVSHYGRRALRRIEEQQRQQEQQAEVEAPGAPAAASESQRLLDVGSSAAVGDADSA